MEFLISNADLKKIVRIFTFTSSKVHHFKFHFQGTDYAGWAKTGLAGWGLTKRWENYFSTWTGISCYLDMLITIDFRLGSD